jgi:acetolactate synthase-1/2/3 large subunit
VKTSDLLVRALENEGVEYVFGVPGEENLDLIESLRTSKVRLIVTRHEQAAGFMAAAYGRLTGRPGVALSTLGPGATNLLTAVSYALLGGMPAVFITGQKPIRRGKQGRFQIVSTVRLMEVVTKSARQIVDGNNVPHLVRDAFRIAMEEKPGPVHLELPEDIAREEVDGHPFPVTTVLPPGASLAALRRAAELIGSAKRPVVCVASGANRHQVRDALRKLVDKSGLYFFNTQMGKGVIDERHPRFLGTAALSDDDYLHCAIHRADLILNVGHDLTEKPPFLMHPANGTGAAPHQTVIHLADSPAQIDSVYFPEHEVIGCVCTNVQSLCDLLEPSPNWSFEYFECIKAEVERNVYARSDATSFPPLPQRIVSDVRECLPSNAVLSLDNGMYKIWFARSFKAHEPNSVLLDNALASMGAGLPAAIAAKLVCPERKVVAICGDGGFLMSAQELETCVRLGLDLTVVVLRDDAYGMIKWKQAGASFPSFGLDFGNPDFVRYAECFGARGYRVEHTEQLRPLLSRCLEERGPCLLEVPIDYRENERVFLEELRQKTCLI